MPVLEAEEIRVQFGGLLAVHSATLAVDAGRITGLIGPNGAGKTTLFNVISGVTEPNAGCIRLDGRDISGLAPHKRARLGIGRTFQRLEVFSTMSVRDNIRTGVEIRQTWDGSRRDPGPEVAELLDRVGLEGVADLRVDQIPTGQARLVELARALAIRPRVLLLDEPASGLDDVETDQLGELLVVLADAGLGILLVEHDVGLVMRICARVAVLDLGCVIAEGDAASVQRDPAVLDAYLGRAPLDGGQA